MARKIKPIPRSMGTIQTIEGARQSSSSVSRSAVTGRYVTKTQQSKRT